MTKLICDFLNVTQSGVGDTATLTVIDPRMSYNGMAIIVPEEVSALVDDTGTAVFDNVDPGPVVVTLKRRRHASSLFPVVIPNEPEVTLADLLGDKYPYTPEQISAAREAADIAKKMAREAEAAAADAWRAVDTPGRVGTGVQTISSSESGFTFGLSDGTEQVVEVAPETRTFTGNGSPEGKVSAPVGAVYIDRVAATGGVRWIKATGTGPTGWRILWGDTGERDIRGLFPEGHRFALSTIRRIGDVVHLSINSWLPPEDGTSRLIGFLPTGFGSKAPRNFPGVLGGTPGGRLLVSLNHLTAYGLRSTGETFYNVSWPTADPWPPTLPGVPA